MSGSNQLYQNGVSTACDSNFAEGPLDCLYDADEGKLSILNLNNDKRHEIIGIDKRLAMVPHIGPHSMQSVSMYPIGVKDFGDKNCKVKGREKK